MTTADKEEMREYVDVVVRPVAEEVERIKVDQEVHKNTLEALAKAVERLSLVVVGDDELKFVGLGQRMGAVEERMTKIEKGATDSSNETKLTRTKFIWFALGAAVVLNLLLRIIPWEWIARAFEKMAGG